jgi:hypothetical protein
VRLQASNDATTARRNVLALIFRVDLAGILGARCQWQQEERQRDNN